MTNLLILSLIAVVSIMGMAILFRLADIVAALQDILKELGNRKSKRETP
jgi:hypothetical protein